MYPSFLSWRRAATSRASGTRRTGRPAISARRTRSRRPAPRSRDDQAQVGQDLEQGRAGCVQRRGRRVGGGQAEHVGAEAGEPEAEEAVIAAEVVELVQAVGVAEVERQLPGPGVGEVDQAQ